MTLRRVAVSMVIVLGLVGCSNGGNQRADTVEPRESAPTSEAAPTPDAPRQATRAQVKAALLAVTDLPTGWSQENDEDDDEADFAEGCPELAALDDSFGDSGKKVPEAEVGFSRDELGPFIGQAVGSLESEKAVSAGIAKLKKAFDACSSFTYKDEDGDDQKVEIAPVSFAQLGDQTLAARLSLETEGARVRMTIVAVRVRNHAILLFGMGVTSVFGGGQLDAAEFEKVAKAAVRKVDRKLP